jgi:hypothetical protein
MEVLRPQENQHALGGELVLAQFDTRVLAPFKFQLTVSTKPLAVVGW